MSGNVWWKSKTWTLPNVSERKRIMSQKSVIVFVCEHGAAKSIIAAAYFNHMARQKGMAAHSIARGTNPDSELSPKTVAGLQSDGLSPTESAPRKLTLAEVESAEQIISFCELPQEYENKMPIEQWNDILPVSENYETARNAIIVHIHQLLNSSSYFMK
jgi:protein-tyrosine-phosphatase